MEKNGMVQEKNMIVMGLYVSKENIKKEKNIMKNISLILFKIIFNNYEL